MLADRYNLLGVMGLRASGTEVRMPGQQGEEDLPILIITALNGSGKHPPDAFVNILKNIRKRFAPFFSTIYISLAQHKGSGLASYVDDGVNRNLYRLLLPDVC